MQKKKEISESEIDRYRMYHAEVKFQGKKLQVYI